MIKLALGLSCASLLMSAYVLVKQYSYIFHSDNELARLSRWDECDGTPLNKAAKAYCKRNNIEY